MPACVLSDVIGDTHLHLEYLQQNNKIGGLEVEDEEISGIYNSYLCENSSHFMIMNLKEMNQTDANKNNVINFCFNNNWIAKLSAIIGIIAPIQANINHNSM